MAQGRNSVAVCAVHTPLAPRDGPQQGGAGVKGDQLALLVEHDIVNVLGESAPKAVTGNIIVTEHLFQALRDLGGALPPIGVVQLAQREAAIRERISHVRASAERDEGSRASHSRTIHCDLSI